MNRRTDPKKAASVAVTPSLLSREPGSRGAATRPANDPSNSGVGAPQASIQHTVIKRRSDVAPVQIAS